MVDIQPGPSLLESYKAQPHTWHVILGELIDNSFDAGATRVEIKFGANKGLDVIDDGNGCSDTTKMLTLGSHFRQATTKLGRFGVGLKEAACCLWGSLCIKTVHRAILRTIFVDWSMLSRSHEWKIPDPTEESADNVAGTVLQFRKILKNFPNKYEALADELGYTFMPALLDGKQIKLGRFRGKPIICKPYQLPPLDNIVDVEFEVCGKGVHLHAGVVQAEHANRKPGFAFSHGHRVILNSSLGAKHYSTSRVAGIVELKGGWALSKNKTSLIDDERELEDALFAHMESMLAVAQSQAMTITGDAFNKELNNLFRLALGTLTKTEKEKRDPPANETGPVEPKETEKKRKRASKRQPGDVLSDEAKEFLRGGKIDWKSCGDGTFGEVDLKGSVVWLNEDNKRLLAHRAADNTDAVLNIAMGLFVAHVLDQKQTDKFPQFRNMDGFSQIWAKAMESCAQVTQEAALSK